MKLGPFEFRFQGGKSGVSNPSQWLLDWLGAGKSSTGIDVHETTAMQSVAVYACVKVLAETMATLPLPVYRVLDGGGKLRAPEHPLYGILHDAPNPEMTSVDFRATMMTHLMLWGNAYAEIERDQAGRPIALWPLRPDRMQIWRGLEIPYQLEYWYSLYTGGMAVLAPDQVLHVKNLSIDGIRGLSPIAHQREAIGLTLALESYAGHFFGNDSTPGGFLSHPGKLDDKARENIKKGWEAGHRGLDNAHRMAVLEEGISFQKVGIPPEDAQFIQSRQYQLTEIARMYRVPLHLIGEMGRVTHANIEHMGIDYVTHTIRPICVLWEQLMAQKLFSQTERGTYFAEFNVDALLRGDLASRYQAYAVGRQWGFLNVDEIRDKENLNPLPDGLGQEYLSPLNMTITGQAPVLTPDAAPPGTGNEPDDSGSRSLDWQRWLTSELDRIGRIERERVGKSAKTLLGKGDLRAFQRWIVEFYGQKLPPMIQEGVSELPDLAKDKVAHLAEQHAQRSLSELQEVLLIPESDHLDAVEAVLERWRVSRVAETLQNERFILKLPESSQPQPGSEERVLDLANRQLTALAEVTRALATQPAPNITVNVEAPAPVVVPPAEVRFDGPTVNVSPAQVEVRPADVINNIAVEAAPTPNVTIEGDTINVAAPEVPVNVTVEGAIITPQIQQPDVTILPAENVINVNMPPPEPSRGVTVLYDGAGKVIGTAPRSAPKVEETRKSPKKLK